MASASCCVVLWTDALRIALEAPFAERISVLCRPTIDVVLLCGVSFVREKGEMGSMSGWLPCPRSRRPVLLLVVPEPPVSWRILSAFSSSSRSCHSGHHCQQVPRPAKQCCAQEQTFLDCVSSLHVLAQASLMQTLPCHGHDHPHACAHTRSSSMHAAQLLTSPQCARHVSRSKHHSANAVGSTQRERYACDATTV